MNKEQIKQMYENHIVDKEDVYQNIMLKIEEQNNPKMYLNKKRILTVCMSVILMIGGLTGYAMWAEAKEYQQAIAFFEEYDLPTEGLSRSDIKAVYKDITLKTFSYEKTIEILNTISTELYSVDLGTKNQQDLENFWNCRNAFQNTSPTLNNGIHYIIEDSSEAINERYPKTNIKKYNGQTLLWSTTVNHSLYCENSNFIECPQGTILYGITAEKNSQWFGIVMMFDKQGKLLWENISEKADSEFNAGLLDEDQIVIFGKRFYDDFNGIRHWSFLYHVYDLQGNLVKSSQQLLQQYRNVSAAVKIGDSYLVKFSGFNPGDARETSELITVSKQGTFIEQFTYSQDGKNYFIRDIFSYGGKIYLSALLPNIENVDFEHKFQILESEFSHAWEKGNSEEIKMPENFKKQLRDLFIEQYTAVLLVCDDNGKISTAYTCPNARGGTFSLSSNHNLEWQVLRVDDVQCASPMLSSRRVDIAATEFRFVFHENGKLLEKDEIGTVSLFY